MSDVKVIDSHIHFWDPDRLPYPWLRAEPRLRRAFRPESLRTGSVAVEGLVFVEADCQPPQPVAEVEWALGLSSPSLPIVGAVASTSLDLAVLEPELQALQQVPAVKGVRRLLQDVRPGFCAEPDFVRAVRSLAGPGLVFDLCVRDHQLREVTALVRRCPEVTFVLDHVGKPRVRSAPERSWLADLERLAALPNTRCKLSGLATEVVEPIGDGRPGELFRPYLEHALQAFGPSRCMFGSDWPVASLAVTYEGWFDHVTAALAGFSTAEVDQVLRGTALRVYASAGVAGGRGCGWDGRRFRARRS